MPSSVITRKSRFAIPLPSENTEVSVKVEYGYGQFGGSALERPPGSTPVQGEQFNLGPANKLPGTYAIMRSIVYDHSTLTNLVDARYIFTCGNTVVKQAVVPVEVENDGDPAILLSRFEFQSA